MQMLSAIRNATLGSLAFLCLLCSSASAAGSTKDGMDSTHQYINATFRMIDLDTLGSDYLKRIDVREHVWRSLDALPSFVFGRELTKIQVVNLDTTVFIVDSLVHRIKSVVHIDNDSFNLIPQRPAIFWEEEKPVEVGPTRSNKKSGYSFFEYWADTITLFPTPQNPTAKSDTVRIQYYQQPFFDNDGDSGVVTMPRVFQMGVIYHAAFLAEQQLNRGRVAEAWTAYQNWVAAMRENIIKKPVDLYKSESFQR